MLPLYMMLLDKFLKQKQRKTCSSPNDIIYPETLRGVDHDEVFYCTHKNLLRIAQIFHIVAH